MAYIQKLRKEVPIRLLTYGTIRFKHEGPKYLLQVVTNRLGSYVIALDLKNDKAIVSKLYDEHEKACDYASRLLLLSPNAGMLSWEGQMRYMQDWNSGGNLVYSINELLYNKDE